MGRRLISPAAGLAVAALALAGCGASGRAPAAAAPAAALRAADLPRTCEGDGLDRNASVRADGATTGPSVRKIQQNGYLRVATNGDVRLWGATNTTTGSPEGYDVALAKEIAESLGVKIRYTVIPYSERQRVLASDRVDLVAQQMTITCERWQGTPASGDTAANPAINLSIPYYTSGARFLVRAGSAVTDVAGLKGQPVCGTVGSTSLEAARDSGVRAVTAPSAGQCLVKFQEGEVAAVVGDATTLAGFKAQDDATTIVGDDITPGQYGLGTQAGADDFTAYVNAQLVRMRGDGTLDRLYATWMKPVVGGSAPRLPAPVYGRG